MNLEEKPLKRYLFLFLSGLLAGIFIGLGGLVNLVLISYSYRVLGALAFSFGLLLVCLTGSHLYTGQIGFVIPNRHKLIWLDLLIMLIANLIGAALVGYLSSLFAFNDALEYLMPGIVNSRIIVIDDWMSYVKAFVGSMFCGAMVFIAVYGFKNFENYLVKVLVLILAIFTFVITGMEHCIANMFYFVFGLDFSNGLGIFLDILITIIGNSIGAILLYLLVNAIKPLNKKSE